MNFACDGLVDAYTTAVRAGGCLNPDGVWAGVSAKSYLGFDSFHPKDGSVALFTRGK